MPPSEPPEPDIQPLISLVSIQQPGTVSLVGAGPGDPALVSVKGALRVAQADVVLYDGLVSDRLLRLVGPMAETVFVGKRRGAYQIAQADVHKTLIEKAKAGLRVVRLKGGDPFVFGRGGEEGQALAEAGIRFEIVPGITAAVAAPAYAGIPMTHRGKVRTFAVVTGHADPANDADALELVDFTALAGIGTVAFYMGHMNLRANCDRLIEAGMDPQTPAAVIQSGTNPDQRTVVGTVGDIADRCESAGLVPPVMVLIGAVVDLREHLNWFETLPLFGQRVLVTRAADQSSALTGRLTALGAEVIEAPTISIQPVEDFTAVDTALRNLHAYDWLVLTSANGVDAMIDRLAGLDLDGRALAGLSIAAIGSATAKKLRDHFINPDLIPEKFVAEKLADQMIRRGAAGKRCLLLRADIARGALPRLLTEAEARCDDLPIYRTVRVQALPDEVIDALRARRVDWVTFTSSSTFRNFVELLTDRADARTLLGSVKLASIGPVTSQTMREAGVEPTVEAAEHTIDGLIRAIADYSGS